MKKTVALLFGGVSSEYAVSCVSAACVADNINKEVYDVRLIGITEDGKWYLYSGDTDSMRNHTWDKKTEFLTSAVISPSKTHHGILLGDGTVIHVDAVFPVLHGKNGEDGTVQGLLQLAEIPYVGCDMTSSAACMDKALTNALADRAGIPQAKWLSYTEHEYRSNPHKALDECVEKLGYPIFVKPAKAGSSVGISKANDLNELADAFETAFANDSKVVLEETVIGSEVECAVLGNDEPVAATPGEIAPCNDFYDFDAKYVSGDSGLFIPARISEDMLKKVQKEAIRAYKALGCSGFSRVDFFVNGEEIKLNEINTIPGFTSISMYPKLWAHSGLAYPELIDKLLCLAIEKRAREI